MSGVSIRRIDPAELKSLSLLKEIEALLDRVRQRAFELFEQRAGAGGNEVDDWLNAQEQLLAHAPAELVERKKNFEIAIAAPGFTAGQLNIAVLPDSITVLGKAENRKELKHATVYFSELAQRDLLRRFDLPAPIEPAQVHASLEDGVLKIVARKAEAPELKLVSAPQEKQVKQKTAAA
jgi:HSP20 family molecular chaperone IbpA